MTDKLVVMGQGYVGLPISMRAVEVGFDVVGLDIDRLRIEALQQGRSYVEDVSDEQVAGALATGRFLATDDPVSLDGFDYVVITVPTPLTSAVPDLTFITDAARAIGPHVRPGSTVVLESTTYPGTTEELLVPALEELSGLKAGVDFHVGYSPERIDPGNQVYTFVSTPKVVAGVNESSSRHVLSLYDRLVETTVPVSSPKEAELTKLLENTFRHVNIALVNELAVFAHALGIDVWEAIDAASTKPFGFMRFTPGPGVGGHCLPIDPTYLSWQVKQQLGKNFRFVELANDVNDHMPEYVVQRLMAGLNAERKALNGSSVVAIGLTYKKNTGDIRESPALAVVQLLASMGARVKAVDPYVTADSLPDGIELVDLDAVVMDADAIVILTDHDNMDFDAVAAAPGYVLDTRRRLGGRRESL